MAAPLDGIRVVELGVVIAGPAASGILADWGASVIKLEPLDGDPQRGNTNWSYFALDNRGKRSVAIDLKQPAGVQVVFELIERADVFVTNLRTSALVRLGLDYDALAARFPGLVYASITGYGPHGPAADKPGYDIGAFWSRAGVALSLTPKGSDPPVQRPGIGDHTTALATAGGIAAALVGRARDGNGQLVTASLLRTGAYVVGSDLNSEVSGIPTAPGLRRILYNPLLGVYRSGDDRWFWLLGVQATRHWPNVMRAIGRPELTHDERFTSMDGLIRNRAAAMAVLDEAFATRTMAEWIDVFAAEDVWWDPLQTFEQVATDPIVLASGAIRERADSDLRTVATPIDFSTVPVAPAPRAPEAGEQTEEILLELGYDWEQISALRADGVI